jgi:mannosyltransferase OCH1-like enzyme
MFYDQKVLKQSQQPKIPIPKIIHLSYKSKESIPEMWINVLSAWQRTNPKWQIMFHDDTDNDRIVKNYFPWFWNTYSNFEYTIQRVDSVRPCYLYLYGGVYIDMDYEPLKAIDKLFANKTAEIYLTESPNVSTITNSFMASVPNHPFWIIYLKQMQKPTPIHAIGKHLKVMNSTGPLKLHKIYNNILSEQKELGLDLFKIEIIPAKLIHPCNRCNNNCEFMKNENEDEAPYFLSLQGGTWNGLDSLFFNYIMCNWHMIVIFTIILLILGICFYKFFKNI